MPIRTLNRRFPRLGRVSAGRQVKNATGTLYPKREKTFVFTSDSLERLEVLAQVYGGTPERSPTASADEDKYVLVSGTMRLRVRLPAAAGDPRTCSQYMEAWASSGLVRRCDGIDCLIHRQPPTTKTDRGKKITVPGELVHDTIPCVCDTDGLEGDDACKPVVRLSVLLADDEVWQRLPGMGVFVVQSGGYASNTELASDLEIIDNLLGDTGAGLPLILDLVQVSSRHGDVPMMRLTVESTPAEVMALRNVSRIADLPSMNAPELVSAADETPVGTFIRPHPNDDATPPASSSAEAPVEEPADALPPGAASTPHLAEGTVPPPDSLHTNHEEEDEETLAELQLTLAGLLERHKIPDRDANSVAGRIAGHAEPLHWRIADEHVTRTLIARIRQAFPQDA